MEQVLAALLTTWCSWNIFTSYRLLILAFLQVFFAQLLSFLLILRQVDEPIGMKLSTSDIFFCVIKYWALSLTLLRIVNALCTCCIERYLSLLLQALSMNGVCFILWFSLKGMKLSCYFECSWILNKEPSSMKISCCVVCIASSSSELAGFHVFLFSCFDISWVRLGRSILQVTFLWVLQVILAHMCSYVGQSGF